MNERQAKTLTLFKPWTATDSAGTPKLVVIASSRPEAQTNLHRKGLWHPGWKLRPATEKEEAKLAVFNRLEK